VAALVALGAGTVIAPSGCGGGSSSDDLVVFGASSLQAAFDRYGSQFSEAPVNSSYGGSDVLAAQIEHGAQPDVFASADTHYPRLLYRQGLVERPRLFAGNRLVIAVPKGSPVHSLADLEKPGVQLVIGDRSVPVGVYTRTVLARLSAGARRAILANVRSQESEVASITAKLTTGAAAAGFVYATDALAAGGDLRTIRLPKRLQPDVAYAAAVVKGAEHPAVARDFLAGIVHGRGQRDLRAAGFLPPPG
jgi:molybdate transport system substrate-binding protein